jgi:hypothetical protein
LQASPRTIRVPMHPVIPRPDALMDHRYNSLPFSIQNSNSYSLTSQTFMLQGSHIGPPPRDIVGRVSRSRAASNVTATAASSWILAATTFRWILATTASSRLSRPEFQHSPTFRPWILATAVVGHLQLEGRLTARNASVDNIDTTAATTFFFATAGKSFVPTFNCSIRNTSKWRTSHLLVHLCLQASFFIGRKRVR